MKDLAWFLLLLPVYLLALVGSALLIVVALVIAIPRALWALAISDS